MEKDLSKAAAALGSKGGMSRSPAKVKAGKENVSKAQKERQRLRRLEKKADDLTRKLILARDKRCVICGSTEVLQWSHLITRRKIAVRWDPLNSVIMCRSCHARHHKQGPEEYISWFLRTYGAEEYQSLVQRANRPLSSAERKELIEYIAGGGEL